MNREEEKKKPLYQKFEVKKITNPTKKMDCIVLEFDDPIDRVGIKAWAEEMQRQGYDRASAGAFAKLLNIEQPGSVV